jgi:hypothetical protein
VTVSDSAPAGRLTRYGRLVGGLLAATDATDVALKLLPVLAKLGLPSLAALLIRNTLRPLTPSRGRIRVLAIEKAVFNDDVLQVLQGAPEVQVFGVKRAVIKAVAVGFLPRVLRDDATYISNDPALEHAKGRLHRFWRALWPKLGRFDVVVTGNWCYWAEREMASALEALDTPFVVIHKEGIKPPARSAMLRDLFRRTRGAFGGRRVLVYHESERQHQVEGGIARPDQVRIVGMPRLDALHAWRRRAAEGAVPARAKRPTVLFAAFVTDNFLPSYSGIDSDLAWSGLAEGCYAALLRLARENPDIDVIVRPRMHEKDGVAALFPKNETWPANLRLVAEGDIRPLLEAAWVVSGHNTTVLLEGLAMGKPVVVPHFAEAVDPLYAGYIVDIGAAAEHAGSPDALMSRLVQLCRAPVAIAAELSPASREALAAWTGNPDGCAAERARDALLSEISRNARLP